MITRRQLLRTLPAAAGALTACGERQEAQPRFQLPKRPISVITTTVHAADLLREVGGETVTVKSLIPTMTNPHLWQPTAADLSTVQTADVFVMSGLGLEAKFTEDLDTLRKTGLLVAVLADVLTESEIIRPGEASDPPDPHFWMNASLWSRAAGKAAEVLAEASPPAANFFKDRAHEYATELMLVHRSMLARFQEPSAKARFFVSSHDSLRYLAEAYGLSGRSIWDSKGGEFPEETRKMIGPWVESHGLKVLFRENFTDSTASHTAMHPLGLSTNKLIASLTLGPPGTLMSSLSEELDISKFKAAFRFTCETIYSRMILAQ